MILVIFSQLKIEAENIFHSHLDVDAPMPVNIDSCAVKDAEEQLQSPNCDMFHLQQQQVMISCGNWNIQFPLSFCGEPFYTRLVDYGAAIFGYFSFCFVKKKFLKNNKEKCFNYL